jgi:hypothetical protein
LSSYISVTARRLGCRTRLPASSPFAHDNRHREILLFYLE